MDEEEIRRDERRKVANYIRANIDGDKYNLARLSKQIDISRYSFGIIDTAIYNLSIDIECGVHAKQQ